MQQKHKRHKKVSYWDLLEKQDKRVRFAIFLSVFGLILFLALAITLPFNDTVFQRLFPKDPSSAQSAEFVDEFESSSLGSGWEFINPKNDSSYSLTSNPGKLSLTIPAGSEHSCWIDGLQTCVRMLRPFDGGDVLVETQIPGGTLTQSIQTYGIIFWQDNRNYIVFSYRFEDGQTFVSGYSVINNRGASEISRSLVMSNENRIRIFKNGNTYTHDYSTDAVRGFVNAKSYTKEFNPTKVGLVAISNGLYPEVNAQFDYFSIKPVDVAALSPAPPPPGSFVFSAAGDHGRGDSGDHYKSMVAVGETFSSFYLALGDLSYSPGYEQQWCSNFKSKFNNVAIIAGNHDTGENNGGAIDNYIQHCPFPLDTVVGNYGKQYYFDYPQNGPPVARFIMISPLVRGSILDIGSSYGPGQAGYVFTENAIDDARAKGIKWIVAGMHKPCITIGTADGCAPGLPLMNMMINKGVDLILQGHDHHYQRSHQLKCMTKDSFDPTCVSDDGADGQYIKGKGSVVLINGMFGLSSYALNLDDPEKGYFTKWMGGDIATQFGFSQFTVSENEIRSDFIANHFPSNFEDTFRITDDGSAPVTSVTPTTTPTRIPTPTVTPIRTPTPSATQTVVFSAAGDHGKIESDKQGFNTAKSVGTSGSEFYLALGDLSYNAGYEQTWCNQFHQFFDNVIPIAGNHDAGESSGGNINNYIQYCPFPYQNITGDYGKQFYFDYPQNANPLARVIMISPGVLGSLNIPYGVGTSGYVFTENAIDDARAKGIKWIIVGMHENCISMRTGCTVGLPLMNLLASKKVDLILQGHDHDYQRTHQLKCFTHGSYDPNCVADNNSNSTYTKGNGPLLVINGAFGASLDDINLNDPEFNYFKSWSAGNINPAFGFSKFTMTPTSLTGEFVQNKTPANFADTFTITTSGTGGTNPTSTPTPTRTPTSPPSTPTPTATTPTSTSRPTNTPIPIATNTPQPQGYTVTGTVYDDLNKNAVKDTSEVGRSGVTVTLGSRTVTTPSTGVYTFTNVAAGTYSVSITPPTNYGTTTPNPVSVSVTSTTTVNFGVAPLDNNPNAITPGQMNLEVTFNSIGIELGVAGDSNKNATAQLSFKKKNETSWRTGLPLWHTGAVMYGSALLLDPGTEYDVRVIVNDLDGVAGVGMIEGSVSTRVEDIAPASSLNPTHFVRTDGNDANPGTSDSPSGAWKTLTKAMQSAPTNAIVQVGPGYHARSGAGRTSPVTIIAQFPALDDLGNVINQGKQSYLDYGNALITSPSNSTNPNDPNKGVWKEVALTGPVTNQAFKVWKLENLPKNGCCYYPGHLGYAMTREDTPRRIAIWSKNTPEQATPEGWAEFMYRSTLYNYGFTNFANSTTGLADMYVRMPGDLNPNNFYMTLGKHSTSSGLHTGSILQFNSPGIRFSGFNIRGGDVYIRENGDYAVFDHNILSLGALNVEGNKSVTPNNYPENVVIQYNKLIEKGLSSRTLTPDEDYIPAWSFVKGGHSSSGKANEVSAVDFRGGGNNVVVRYNIFDGLFNGVSAYNADFDRFASYNTDIHNNLFINIPDDAMEPEQVASNWRMWNNRIENTAVVLSADIGYGPIYFFRNSAWNITKEGVGRTSTGGQGVASLFVKYGGATPASSLYMFHNTLYTTSSYCDPTGDTGCGVDGFQQYAGGTTPLFFYGRNNILYSTRYAAKFNDDTANYFATADPGRGMQYGGKTYTTNVTQYRSDYLTRTGKTTNSNIGWDESRPVGQKGDFITSPSQWLIDSANGNVNIKSGTPFVNGGISVPNISDNYDAKSSYSGSAPDLGYCELGSNCVTLTIPTITPGQPTATPTPGSATPTITKIPTATPTGGIGGNPTSTPIPTATSIPVSPTVSLPPGAIQHTFTVNSGSDDVAEFGSSYNSDNTLLRIGGCGSSACYVGLRLDSVTLPKGAEILSAYLQVFTANGASSPNDAVEISAHATGNSSPFSGTTKPSTRILTSANVQHQVSTVVGSGVYHTVEDVSPVIQELINRSDWENGNAMSLILKSTNPTNSDGIRAYSYEGRPSESPRLVVAYLPISTPTNTPIPPTSTTTPIPTYTLSGEVFVDNVIVNGVRDSGEDTYSGVSVTLTDGTNVRTNTQGRYTFNNVTAGVYTVTLSTPPGYVSLSTNPRTVSVTSNTTVNYALAEIVPTATPTSTPVPPTNTPIPPTNTPVPPTVTVPPPAATPTPTATRTPTPTPTVTPIPGYTLRGKVYIDANNNGVDDSGETVYTGALVSLSNGESAQTNPTGEYTFSNLLSDIYEVELTVPSGYVSATQNPVTVSLATNSTVNFGIRVGVQPTATPTPTPTIDPEVTPTDEPVATNTPIPPTATPTSPPTGGNTTGSSTTGSSTTGSSTGSTSGTQKKPDQNNDGKVNIFDLSVLLSNWNKSGTNSDLNSDGRVNIFDLSILLKQWGK